MKTKAKAFFGMLQLLSWNKVYISFLSVRKSSRRSVPRCEESIQSKLDDNRLYINATVKDLTCPWKLLIMTESLVLFSVIKSDIDDS